MKLLFRLAAELDSPDVRVEVRRRSLHLWHPSWHLPALRDSYCDGAWAIPLEAKIWNQLRNALKPALLQIPKDKIACLEFDVLKSDPMTLSFDNASKDLPESLWRDVRRILSKSEPIIEAEIQRAEAKISALRNSDSSEAMQLGKEIEGYVKDQCAQFRPSEMSEYIEGDLQKKLVPPLLVYVQLMRRNNIANRELVLKAMLPARLVEANWVESIWSRIGTDASDVNLDFAHAYCIQGDAWSEDDSLAARAILGIVKEFLDEEKASEVKEAAIQGLRHQKSKPGRDRKYKQNVIDEVVKLKDREHLTWAKIGIKIKPVYGKRLNPNQVKGIYRRRLPA